MGAALMVIMLSYMLHRYKSRNVNIAMMEWLISDIRNNRLVTTLAQLEESPVPEFEVNAE